MLVCERISVIIDQSINVRFRYTLSELSGIKISNTVSTCDVSCKTFSIYVTKSLTNGFPTDEIKRFQQPANQKYQQLTQNYLQTCFGRDNSEDSLANKSSFFALGKYLKLLSKLSL